jgi:hypothetical protein
LVNECHLTLGQIGPISKPCLNKKAPRLLQGKGLLAEELSGSGPRLRRARQYRNLPVAFGLPIKTDMACHFGEQGVILANAHVQARLELGPVLADQDGACRNQHAAKSLATKPLAG